MNDLLKLAVASHGGLDRWNQVTSITVGASITGALWDLKRNGHALKDVRFVVDTTKQLLKMDVVSQVRRTVFDRHRAAVQDPDGAVIDARTDPESAFDGHRLATAWHDLHVPDFGAAARWTCLNSP